MRPIKRLYIRLNDIRQLSLVNILVIACLYSKHFRRILAVENDYALSQCMDRSFTFLAEIVMNCGLLEKVVTQLGMVVYEHTSMTQFEKLSPHLCRGMLMFIRRNAIRCMSLCLAYNFSDESLDQSWFFQKLVKNQNDSHLFLMKRLGMKKEILRKIGLRQPRMILSKIDVITQWRARF